MELSLEELAGFDSRLDPLFSGSCVKLNFLDLLSAHEASV